MTPPPRPRIGPLLKSVRRLAQKGWSAFAIARCYKLTTADVKAALAPPRRRRNKTLVTWTQWFVANGVPRQHVLTALEIAEPPPHHIEQCFGTNRRGAPTPMRPKPHSRNGISPAPQLRSRTATKVCRLTELGYPPATIAHLTGLSEIIVRRYQRKGSKRTPPPVSPWYISGDLRRIGSARDDDACEPLAPEVVIVSAPAESIQPRAAEQAAPIAPAPIRWQEARNERTCLGESNGRSKLTWADVDDIRRLHSEGLSAYAIAKRYCLNAGTVRAILKDETWKESNRPTESECAPVPEITATIPAKTPKRARADRSKRWRRRPGEARMWAPGSGSRFDDTPPSPALPRTGDPPLSQENP